MCAKTTSTNSTPRSEWIDYKEAAAMMHRPPQYLRYRGADGQFLYWPEIERWQPGGFRTRLYLRREHVETWIERSQAKAPVKQDFKGLGYESALPTLRRLGATKTMRALGLK